MAFSNPSRSVLGRALRIVLVACCLLSPAVHLAAQPLHPGFGPRQTAPSHSARPQQEHLGQWMDHHRNLSLQQQQSALEREPGFHDLPPQTQQRMRDHLTQLNNMPPEQRSRLLARTEIMERLSPEQRQRFRNSVQELGALPADRRRLVARAFRDIREMPIPQRQAVLSSDRFHSQFSDRERSTLASLLAVEPYLPVQHHN
jgi:hypothetical protein